MQERISPKSVDLGDDKAIPLAVALAGNRGRAVGSKVLAKGRGDFAEQIIEIALAHGIPLHENSELAEILEAIEPEGPNSGEYEVPIVALAAVAEILSYLYLNQDEALDDEVLDDGALDDGALDDGAKGGPQP